MVDAGTSQLRSAPGKNLALRFASAFVLVPLTLFAVWRGGWLFLALIGLASMVMIQEWNRLTTGQWVTGLAAVEAAAIVSALVLAAYGMTGFALMLLGAAAALAGLLAAVTGQSPVWGLLAAPYLGLPLISLVWLRTETSVGTAAIFWVLALVWLCDTAAFVTGKTVGGPKLAPRISPKKTWSGSIGGIVAGAALGAAAANFQGWGTIPVMIGLGIALSAWAQLGDLAESSIKRRFGAKDSGTLIPGHGGILDRLDSLLFAAPAVAGLVYWLGGGLN